MALSNAKMSVRGTILRNNMTAYTFYPPGRAGTVTVRTPRTQTPVPLLRLISVDGLCITGTYCGASVEAAGRLLARPNRLR